MKSIFAAAASLAVLASADAANVVELAQATDSLSTLVDLVVANDLTGTLSTASPITVFAPTNEAFTEYLGSIKTPSLECQASILSLHVVEEKIEAADLASLTLPKATLGGANLWSLEQIVANTTDVQADNTGDDVDDSVVHIVNKVLDGSIATTATYAELNTLVAAVVGAGLLGGGPDGTGTRLDDPCDTYTVFAPTDAAFTAVEGVTDFLLPESPVTDNYLKNQLTELLAYHVLPQKVDSAAVVATADGTTLDTLAGTPVTVNSTELTIQGARLDAGNLDILAGLGIVHLVQDVLVPPEFPVQTIAQFVSGAEGFTTLLSLLTARPDLLSAVSDAATNSWTVFAPTDAAFETFLQENPNASDEDVTNVLKLHIVNTGLLASEVTAVTELETLGGMVPVSSLDLDQTDVKQLNGVIHTLNSVIPPPTEPETDAPSSSSTMQTSMVLACAALFGKAFF